MTIKKGSRATVSVMSGPKYDIVRVSNSYSNAMSSRFGKSFSFGRGMVSSTYSTGGLFVLIVCMLLFVCLVRMVTGAQNQPTFESFIEFMTSTPHGGAFGLSSLPYISFDMNSFLGGQWIILDEFRQFLAMFISIFNVLIFIFNGIAGALLYVSNFFRWLIIG